MKKFIVIVAIVILALSSISINSLDIANDESIVESKGKTDLDQS